MAYESGYHVLRFTMERYCLFQQVIRPTDVLVAHTRAIFDQICEYYWSFDHNMERQRRHRWIPYLPTHREELGSFSAWKLRQSTRLLPRYGHDKSHHRRHGHSTAHPIPSKIATSVAQKDIRNLIA